MGSVQGSVQGLIEQKLTPTQEEIYIVCSNINAQIDDINRCFEQSNELFGTNFMEISHKRIDFQNIPESMEKDILKYAQTKLIHHQRQRDDVIKAFEKSVCDKNQTGATNLTQAPSKPKETGSPKSGWRGR